MEPDTPDSPEIYPPLPSAVITPEKEEAGKLEYLVVWACVTFLVVLIVLAIFGLNVAPDFLMTDSYCDILIENATNTSLTTGYLQGVYDTSQLVLTQGILPVFMEDGSLEYLNLTQDLNTKQEE